MRHDHTFSRRETVVSAIIVDTSSLVWVVLKGENESIVPTNLRGTILVSELYFRSSTVGSTPDMVLFVVSSASTGSWQRIILGRKKTGEWKESTIKIVVTEMRSMLPHLRSTRNASSSRSMTEILTQRKILTFPRWPNCICQSFSAIWRSSSALQSKASVWSVCDCVWD